MERREAFFLVCLLTYLVVAKAESDDKVSLTFVIDVTSSMTDDIEAVKVAANRICNAVVNSSSSVIKNFVYVTFADPDTEVRAVTKDPNVLKDALANTVTGLGINNYDCPEYALTGTKRGIQNSLLGSFVYIFTDDYAKDYWELEAVRNLAIKKQCQLVFILSDSACGNMDYQIYNDLARSTNGQVFRLQKNNVNEILNYTTELVKRKTTVLVSKTFPAGTHNFNVSVDPTMEHLIVANSGDEPDVKVTSPSGARAPSEPLVNLPKVGIKKVFVNESGTHTITSSAKSDMSVVVTAATDVTFQYGFSVRPPTSFKGLPRLPQSDIMSHLLIKLKSEENIRLDSIQLLDTSGNLLKEIPLKVFDDKQKLYITDKFDPPDVLFIIKFQGVLLESNEPITRSSNTPIEKQNIALEPKEDKAPVIDKEIDLNVVEYDDPLKLECKVHGYPKPQIYWLDEMGAVISDEVITIEVPYDYMNILEIEKVNKNTTYKCSAINKNGNDIFNAKVEAKPKVYFDILQQPKDTNVDYKKDNNIYCKVDAYPPAKLTWYKGDDEIHEDENFGLSTDGTTLTIKEMKPKLIGPYSCRAKNDFNSTAMYFNVIINGITPVIIKNGDNTIKVKYNEPLKVICKVSGYPKPTISWKETGTGIVLLSQTEISLDRLYDYISILTLDRVTKNTTCQCIAENIHGNDTKDVRVEAITHFNVLESPGDEIIEHRTSFQFHCAVEANPYAVVSWHKNESTLRADYNFSISTSSDGASTLTFKEMKPELVGNYSCKIENHLIKKEIYFEVLISEKAPTILTEISDPINVEYNNPLILICNVTGFPKPQIIWSETDTKKVLFSEMVKSNDTLYDYQSILHIKEVKKNTTYQCLAKNSDGDDDAEIQVNAITRFNILLRPEDTSIKHRGNAEIKCQVEANPKAILTWYKNGDILVPDLSFVDITMQSDGKSVLNIKQMDARIAGTYSCRAQNEVTMEDMKFEITIKGIEPKVTIDGGPKINAEYEAVQRLVCKVIGYPKPNIYWLNEKTGKILSSNPESIESTYDYGVKFYIDRVVENATYTCIAKNSFGENSDSVRVETVKKTYFNIIEEPTDIIIEYQKDGEVTCKIDANPPAKVVWYGDRELKNDSHISISSDGSILRFINMQAKLKGSYTCRANNIENIRSFDFQVSVSGLERPLIDKSDKYKYINVKEGSEVDVICRVISGTPEPTFSWEFYAGAGYNRIEETSDTIHFASVERDRTGRYRCRASNAAGIKTLSIQLTVEYLPTIEKTEKTITLKHGDPTTLKCVVKGKPDPNVSWYLNDHVITKSHRNYIFHSDNSLSFTASAGNHGTYTCMATNKHGATNNSIEVKYFVPVNVDIPEESTLEVMVDEKVEMPCIADGYPAPVIKWLFISAEANYTSPKLLRTTVSPDTLVLKSVKYYHDGYYICQVDNKESNLNLAYEVRVNGPPQISSTGTVKAIKGDAYLRIPCKALGRPKPVIQWIRNGVLLAVDSDTMIADDGSLILKGTEDGEYFCKAENKHGTDNKLVEVILEDFPTPLTPKSTKTLRLGDNTSIKCDISYTDVDQMRWFKDNKLIGEKKLLEFNRVSVSDAGVYTCRVSTLHASESRSVRINVT